MDEDDAGQTLADSDAAATLIASEGLFTGTVIAGYAIDGVIGEGGMGVVYSGTHPVIGKRAAIKVLSARSSDPAAVERFLQEARAVNQIGHPNIVDIFDFGQLPDGREYLVMDLLDGETLRARLQRGPLHISEAALVIDACASALIAAHGKGIVHRDLKPDNVFLVTVPNVKMAVKLLDFGAAKLMSPSGRDGRGVKTKTGTIVGTPSYMSPEQARAQGVDHRTDIYALGVMSFELLSGQLPFRSDNALDMMIAHESAPIPSLLGLREVPVEVAQLIEAMLAKAADDRPTLAAVRAVLKRLAGTVIPMLSAAGLKLEDVGLLPTAPVPRTESEAESTRGDLPVHRNNPRVPSYVMPVPQPVPQPAPRPTAPPQQQQPPPRAPTHLSPGDAQEFPSYGARQAASRRWWVIALVALTLIGVGLVVVRLVS